MARAAVLALARLELRRSWRTLLLLRVLAGLTAGVALAGVATARRTTTAHDRLLAATALDDARVLLMGRPQAAPEIAALPGSGPPGPRPRRSGRCAGATCTTSP